MPIIVDCRASAPQAASHFMLVLRRDRCQVLTLMVEQSVLCIVLFCTPHRLRSTYMLSESLGLDEAKTRGTRGQVAPDFVAAKRVTETRTPPLVAALACAHRIAVARDVTWDRDLSCVRASPPGSGCRRPRLPWYVSGEQRTDRSDHDQVGAEKPSQAVAGAWVDFLYALQGDRATNGESTLMFSRLRMVDAASWARRRY
jgi:hypothetical protein